MNCSKCNNTGWIIYTDKDGYETARECDCVKQRQSLARLESSGLFDYKLKENKKCKREDFVPRKDDKSIKELYYNKGDYIND